MTRRQQLRSPTDLSLATNPIQPPEFEDQIGNLYEIRDSIQPESQEIIPKPSIQVPEKQAELDFWASSIISTYMLILILCGKVKWRG